MSVCFFSVQVFCGKTGSVRAIVELCWHTGGVCGGVGECEVVWVEGEQW